MARLVVRLDDECKGARGCPDAKQVSCTGCGHIWEPADWNQPGDCPGCGGSGYVREYCPECPHRYLEQHGASFEMTLLRRAIDWQNALSQECRFHATLADIPAEEYSALQVIRREQSDHLKEKK